MKNLLMTIPVWFSFGLVGKRSNRTAIESAAQTGSINFIDLNRRLRRKLLRDAFRARSKDIPAEDVKKIAKAEIEAEIAKAEAHYNDLVANSNESYNNLDITVQDLTKNFEAHINAIIEDSENAFHDRIVKLEAEKNDLTSRISDTKLKLNLLDTETL